MKASNQSFSLGRPLNFLFFLCLSLDSDAFSPACRLSCATSGVPGLTRSTTSCGDVVDLLGSSSSLHMAAGEKKRRRRKASEPKPSLSDELPDFDDEEDMDVKEVEVEVEIKSEKPVQTKVARTPVRVPSKPRPAANSQLAEELGGSVDGLDDDLVVSVMRGKAGTNWQPPRTIQDTINDRSLEKLMDFDKMIEQDGSGEVVELPTMEQVINRRKQREAADAAREGRVQDVAMLIDTDGMGKKAAKAAQRKAAAAQREAEAEAEKSPFDDLFKDLNALKVLENGAWVGIGLLVLWEFYINSPFFDRAAPLIPVVYDNPVPPGM